MLVSRIKPCKPESKRSYRGSADGSLNQRLSVRWKGAMASVVGPPSRITVRNARLIRGCMSSFPSNRRVSARRRIGDAFTRNENHRQQWQRSTDESGQRAKAHASSGAGPYRVSALSAWDGSVLGYHGRNGYVELGFDSGEGA